jgi:acyl-CoA synthetase (AMP-forming)/AMP-acid ligase II
MVQGNQSGKPVSANSIFYMMLLPTSLVDILQWRAKHQPDRLAYRFLEDGEFAETVWTYKELDQRARSIAALLQRTVKSGDRALLFFPPGLHFIAAFFGCLYAKVIAVPAYPPHPARLEKTLPAVLRLAADAKPAVILLTGLFSMP